MNRIQWFLNKINQEAAELIKDSTKTAMFGLESYDPKDENKTQNIQLVVEEFFDLVAAFEQFIDEVGVREFIPILNDPVVQKRYIQYKKERNEAYLNICLNIRTTHETKVNSETRNLKIHYCSKCLGKSCMGQCGCNCMTDDNVEYPTICQM